MKTFSITPIVLQIVSVLGAGISLFTSRYYSIALIPAILLLGIAVFLAGYSRYRLFSLLLIGIFTSLILSLRFDYLTWGDPWFEYAMIQRILAYQSLDPSVYPSQLPVIHVVISTLSLFSGMNPLDLLKYIIPPLSVIGLYAVYRFTKNISSAETAFFAGLLLLCGTPYLHWTTQGVRETVGIALFVLALYVSFTAMESHKKRYLFISILLIGGLVLTHDLSSVMFLLVWITMSLTFLYLICDRDRIRMTGMFSLLIASTAVIFIVAWGFGRSTFGYGGFIGLMNTIFHSEYGILLFLVSLIILYLIPLKIPDKILLLRLLVHKILMRRNMLYSVFITVSVMSCIVVLNFVLGKSSFTLSYPLPMLFNGACMIVLSLIGLYYFLETDRLHVLAWTAALTLILVLSMSNIVPFVDPLRFMEFIYIPLAIIAAFGITRIAGLPWISKLFPLVLAVFVVISIITSFPSVVFLGKSFEPGHPLSDARGWVIQHQSSEIYAISWLNHSHVRGVIETDTYIRYAARGILFKDPPIIQADLPFMRVGSYPQSSDANAQQHYLLILSRMTKFLEFSAQWLKDRTPISDMDVRKINEECNILYENGDAEIFSFSTP